MPQNFAILAGAGLRLVGIHDKIMRPPILILRHKRPFQPRRKARPTAPAQARRLHLIDDPIPPLIDKELRSVPIATLLGSLQVSAMKPVKIGKNAVFVLQHRSKTSHYCTGASDRSRRRSILPIRLSIVPVVS